MARLIMESAGMFGTLSAKTYHSTGRHLLPVHFAFRQSDGGNHFPPLVDVGELLATARVSTR